MKEWRDVVGYEGLYKVSSDGEIMSINPYSHKKPIIMSQGRQNSGYYTVGLSKGGETRTRLVHRIVAQAFVPNPNNYGFVNHKDENKTNNNFENLEWCTKSYNAIYYLNFDEKRKEKYASRFRDKQSGKMLSSWTTRVPHKHFERVVQKDLDGNIIREFDNSVQASIAIGLKESGNIIAVCTKNRERNGTGKKKRTVKGYVWEFAERNAITET